MKKTFTLLFIAFFITFYGQAQVVEGIRKMSEGTENAYSIVFKDTDKKTLMEGWMKYLRQFGRPEYVKHTSEIFVDNGRIEEMSKNVVDIYSTIIEIEPTKMELVVWYYLGGAYLSKQMHPDRYKTGIKILDNFAEEMHVGGLKSRFSMEEDNLKKLRYDLQKLMNRQGSLEADIAKLEKKLEEAKAELEENKKQQGNKQELLSLQDRLVMQLKAKLEEANF